MGKCSALITNILTLLLLWARNINNGMSVLLYAIYLYGEDLDVVQKHFRIHSENLENWFYYIYCSFAQNFYSNFLLIYERGKTSRAPRGREKCNEVNRTTILWKWIIPDRLKTKKNK